MADRVTGEPMSEERITRIRDNMPWLLGLKASDMDSLSAMNIARDLAALLADRDRLEAENERLTAPFVARDQLPAAFTLLKARVARMQAVVDAARIVARRPVPWRTDRDHLLGMLAALDAAKADA